MLLFSLVILDMESNYQIKLNKVLNLKLGVGMYNLLNTLENGDLVIGFSLKPIHPKGIPSV